MSADLWAEFGSQSSSLPQLSLTEKTNEGNIEKHNHHSNNEKWETDSWAAVNDEIEQAWLGSATRGQASQPAEASRTVNVSNPYIADDDEFGDFEEPDTFENAGVVSSQQQLRTLEPSIRAESFVDDQDDFGDFEEVKPQSATNHGLVSFNDHESPHQFLQTEPNALSRVIDPTTQDSTSLIDINTSPLETTVLRGDEFAQKTSSKSKINVKKEQPVLMAVSDSEIDDDWDDFGSSTLEKHAVASNKDKTVTTSSSAKITKGVVTGKASKALNTTGVPPPTNIPPPSVLMTLACSLLSDLPEQIRVSIVETWEEDEADVKKHLETLQVIARVVAGRKLRWKRDKILAQSMRIGISGRQGGMKLAGVDRAEMQREEREAVELLRVWRANLGSIRTAVSEASSNAAARPSPLPVISENIAIRTIKSEEGGITASRCCVLCGLKREERATKVDTEVWDQFGEWWTDHWGHSSCKRFWEEHEFGLQQR